MLQLYWIPVLVKYVAQNYTKLRRMLLNSLILADRAIVEVIPGVRLFNSRSDLPPSS